ncbi:MAG: phosphotransferase enzyme family protein [Methylobacter sp.]
MNELTFIASRFGIEITGVVALGNGLINDTYLAMTPASKFVLQRVNCAVFPEPEHIMENLAALNRHIAQKDRAKVRLQIPEILPTLDGDWLYREDNGDCWRALSFIADSECLDTINAIDEARQIGFALGHFHRLTSDLNPELLHDTLPGFHITPGYLNQYRQTVQHSLQPQDRYCADVIDRFQTIADDLEGAVRLGRLKPRVIHGDPKLNNVLFHRQTKQAISLIDLDTVKPGLVHYDIGDCVRSCCRCQDGDGFDLDTCIALLQSYLAEAGAFFTEQDYHYLYPAIRLIPFELGIRFYTDYLQGNRYFKAALPDQNLHRAINQFRLCESIVEQETALKSALSQLQPQR